MAGAAIVQLIPLLVTTYAPITDYPNHLARTYILHNYDRVPAFAASFDVRMLPIPNVAIDVIVSALQWVMSPLLAGKVFLIGIVLLWIAGCHLLGRAIHGRATWLAVPCMLLMYHGSFQNGFVNYAMGVGVFFCGLAVWLTRRRRWTVGGMTLVTALACLAYLTHLSAYALFGVVAVTVTLYELVRRRISLAAAVVGGIPFVPPLVLFATFMRGGGQVGGTAWNTLAGKAIAVFSVVRTYDIRLDLVVVGVLGLLALAAVALARGRVRANGATLAATLVLVVLFFICPLELFTSYGADARVVPPAVVLGVLSLSVPLSLRAGARLIAACLAVLTVRMGAITAAWLRLDRQTAEIVALLDRMPDGARVLPILLPREGIDRGKSDRAFLHTAYYSVIRHHDYVALMFAFRSQQPVVAHQFSYGTTDAPTLLRDHIGEFDYVATYGQPPRIRRAIEACCVREGTAAGFYELWRVRPEAGAAVRSALLASQPAR